MRWLALLLVLTVFAGCTDGGPDAKQDGHTCMEDPIPVGEAHDHRDPAQHRFACHATLLAHASLAEFGRSDEAVVGAHAIDVHGTMVALAVNGGDETTGQQGFHLFDVSDPTAPVHVSFWDAGVDVNGDRTIAFSPDGQTVFLGFEDGPRPGVAAVDVSDPTAPVEVAFWSDPLGYGPHTVAAHDVDGTTYVFSLAVGVAILQYDGDFTMVSRFITQDKAGALDLIQFIDPTDPQDTYFLTYTLRSLYGHDMVPYHDEDTGKDLLLVAFGYDGAKIVDISDPRAPVLQASWMPPADTSHKHYTHSMAAERIDGRLVVVVGSETFEDENQGIASPFWILDATDAVVDPPLTTDPLHEGTWRNPSDAPAGALGLSVHFFRLQDGLLYLSHYHGGLWGIDLRTPDARATPQHFAYHMAVPADAVAPPEECCIGWDLDGVPMVFDVAVDERGYVYGADMIQGLVVVQFDAPA